ncbi:prefoldin, alpha subunit [Allomyces macrogynus ATCC 38327]|uniref:Prefoldin, alpha subunit n=1 Tax=Allomyces macrogynus (strain ATCC 38327) TaxID=578462 RepID=A0A0L0SIY8_ALLM3|nr:prefoldin, alpha subunit [Allomyces macrogynus ATCC 38327]|eukprot:KNE62340.1 prefoldin, alpha subunit [Allomyces macrogynus ATCC 38327]
MDDISDAVAQYEAFINEKLRVDLEQALGLRDQVYNQISEYGKLANQIKMLQETGSKELKTQVDLGSNFFVQAKIPDTTYIYVQVAFGFHVQFTLPEAIAFADKKQLQLQKLADEHTRQANALKAQIHVMQQTLQQLMLA